MKGNFTALWMLGMAIISAIILAPAIMKFLTTLEYSLPKTPVSGAVSQNIQTAQDLGNWNTAFLIVIFIVTLGVIVWIYIKR